MNPKDTAQKSSTQQKPTGPKPTGDSKPNPDRFNDYTVLADQTGFRIPNCDFVFEFDTYGGWYDEYKNYYNADGQPTTPPEYETEEDSYGYDEAADALAREYDMGDDDWEEDHLNHYDNIYLNVENKRVLEYYLKDQEINVEIRNMNFKSTEADFEKYLKDKRIEWIEFEFDYDNRDRFTGICYVTLDKPNAQKLIEYNGAKMSGRDIKINILKPDEEEDHDVNVAPGVTGGAQKTRQPEEQKTQWRAPVEKPSEQTTGTTSTAQPQSQTQALSNPDTQQTTQPQSTTGADKNQTQTQSQNQNRPQSQNYQNQRDQGYNQRQNYQENRSQQYQKQGGFQRNYDNQQGQYQNKNFQNQRNQGYGGKPYGQQYSQQNQYQQGQHGQSYQGRNQGYGGQQQSQYPYQSYQGQMQPQGGYPPQYYNAPGNQYGQGGYQQYGYGGQYPQGGQYSQGSYQQAPSQSYQGHQQQQQQQPPKNVGYEQNPGPSGNVPTQEVQAQDETAVPGAWGKELKKKKDEK